MDVDIDSATHCTINTKIEVNIVLFADQRFKPRLCPCSFQLGVKAKSDALNTGAAATPDIKWNIILYCLSKTSIHLSGR